MKVLFDTSVLVAAVVDQLPNHVAAHGCFLKYLEKEHTGYCSTHTLAECYATLTALPLPRRVSAAEALTLVEKNFARRLQVIDLNSDDYMEALRNTAGRGLLSGQIYDALHVAAARKAGCERIYTYNLSHFRRSVLEGIEVTAP
jgi:predicted nucleic acid-binding protein